MKSNKEAPFLRLTWCKFGPHPFGLQEFFSTVIVSGDRGNLVNVPPDHWVHGHLVRVAPLLLEYLASHGEVALLEPLPDVHACSERVIAHCTLFLAVPLDPHSLDDMIAYLAPHNFPPTPLLSLSLVLCTALESVVGTVMRKRLVCEALGLWLGMPFTRSELYEQDIKAELFAIQAWPSCT